MRAPFLRRYRAILLASLGSLGSLAMAAAIFLSSARCEFLGFQNDVLTAKVTPRIWISDTQILHGMAGIDRHQAILVPIRRGEAYVIILDKLGQPIRKVFYTVL